MRPGLIGCLLLLPTLTHAQASARTDADVSAVANAAFRQGIENKAHLLQARKHFSDATDAYLVLHHRGFRSPGFYRNLGNAAFLADRWPIAIWAYHSGLKLDPNDRNMRAHLAAARGKVIYPPSGQGHPDADIWPLWLYRPTVTEFFFIGVFAYTLVWFAAVFYTRDVPYSLLAAIGFLLAALVGILVFVSPKPWRTLLTTLCIWLGTLAGVALWQEWRQANLDREMPLVVITDNADFYRGNGASYPRHPVVPVLPRGLEARQTHRRGDWLQVRLSTGEVGWVHVGHVLIVAP